MSRKSDAETLEALKARKAELDEKIRQKEAAIKEKIRAEEARKRAAEKRRLDHVKYLLGGVLLAYSARSVAKTVAKVAVDKKISESASSEIIAAFIQKCILPFGAIGEKDLSSLTSVLLEQAIKEADLSVDGESVSSSHEK